jgi:hypothetical protein
MPTNNLATNFSSKLKDGDGDELEFDPISVLRAYVADSQVLSTSRLGQPVASNTKNEVGCFAPQNFSKFDPCDVQYSSTEKKKGLVSYLSCRKFYFGSGEPKHVFIILSWDKPL